MKRARIPRSLAFARARRIADEAMSIPTASQPASAAIRTCSPVPQPTSSTRPRRRPSAASAANAGCGSPMSHGGVVAYAASNSATRSLVGWSSATVALYSRSLHRVESPRSLPAVGAPSPSDCQRRRRGARSASLKEWGRVKVMVGGTCRLSVAGVCVRAGVVGVAGVKVGRRPPRRGLALTPASGDADSSSGRDGQRGARVGGGRGCRTVVLTI
jgi:hypothetical protein